MNRPIKFRAWNASAEAMYPSDHFALRCSDGATLQLMPDGTYLPNAEATMAYMQFTGLLDKNGKEIYEGDVVQVEEQIGEVNYETEDGCFVVRFHEASSYLRFNEAILCEWEIIGNLYENPELL